MSNVGMNRVRDAGANGAAVFFLVLGIGSLLCWGGIRIYKSVQFNRLCAGYLKQAADANTVDVAQERLGIAINYIEEHKLTSGFTSVLYTAPNEDVGFWSKNLHKAIEELDELPEKISEEAANIVLMKLRETLLDTTANGQSVTTPPGIFMFPNNVPYALWGFISLVISAAGFISLRIGNARSGRHTSLVEMTVLIAILTLVFSMGGF